VRTLEAEAGERQLVVLYVAGVLALAGHALEALDRPFTLDASRVVRRQVGDQAPDPIANLKREVRTRGSNQLTDVLDRDPVPAREAIGSLAAAQNNHRFAAAVHPRLPPLLNSNPAA
jgi:hypothetical protein